MEIREKQKEIETLSAAGHDSGWNYYSKEEKKEKSTERKKIQKSVQKDVQFNLITTKSHTHTHTQHIIDVHWVGNEEKCY